MRKWGSQGGNFVNISWFGVPSTLTPPSTGKKGNFMYNICFISHYGDWGKWHLMAANVHKSIYSSALGVVSEMNDVKAVRWLVFIKVSCDSVQTQKHPGYLFSKYTYRSYYVSSPALSVLHILTHLETYISLCQIFWTCSRIVLSDVLLV